MRRKELAVDNQEDIEQFLAEMSFGVLATVSADGFPAATPLNFVFTNGSIYFHGARAGEKIANLSKRPNVTFCVAKEYAIIPSYYTDPELACPATAFFQIGRYRRTSITRRRFARESFSLAGADGQASTGRRP
ncbi:pyridoxamine 5'-phosphate oxidase family protein [Paenibacillus gorillae]|uniref:pyridoxamine 5'-phosphate oxidase family protein n=1 Tax=Paenibacillus gorillae TaxID=1243662 RepID=UPI0004AFC43A